MFYQRLCKMVIQNCPHLHKTLLPSARDGKRQKKKKNDTKDTHTKHYAYLQNKQEERKALLLSDSR